MIIQVFMAVCAVVCTAAVARYIWRERGCFKKVFNNIMEEYGNKENN